MSKSPPSKRSDIVKGEDQSEGTPVEQTPTKCSKFWTFLITKQLRIPDHKAVSFLTLIFIFFLIWLALYFQFNEKMLPSGNLFHLVILVLSSYLVGTIFGFMRLPELLGMLITGVVLRSINFIYLEPPYTEAVAVSRDLAMATILIKAGLGLDEKALHSQTWSVIKLCVIPCLGEALTAAVISHLVFGLSWPWGLLLGFLLSSVSPAVVIPPLLALKEKGYGESHGLYTLVVASSALDDISSISAFGIFQAIIFNEESSILLQIIQPVSVILGFVFGIMWGFLCGIIPHRDSVYVSSVRGFLLGIGGVIFVLGSVKYQVPGCGPLVCITAAFVGTICWKRQGWGDLSPTPIEVLYSRLWIVMQPILFSFIGAEIDVKVLSIKEIGLGTVIILGSLAARVACCYLSLIGSTFNAKEKIFVNIAWMPKATVQAALAPQPLDYLRQENNPDRNPKEFEWAVLVLNTAVWAIALTTPICSVCLTTLGTKLLRKDVPLEDDTLLHGTL